MPCHKPTDHICVALSSIPKFLSLLVDLNASISLPQLLQLYSKTGNMIVQAPILVLQDDLSSFRSYTFSYES